MGERNVEFEEIDYVKCAKYFAKFPLRKAIFYFDCGELHQIKSPEEFIRVMSGEMKVYTQV